VSLGYGDGKQVEPYLSHSMTVESCGSTRECWNTCRWITQ